MKRALCIVALLASPAVAKPKQGAWAIQRQTPATLSAKATVDDVATLIVESTWIQPNPKKKTSTWESHFYTFAKDGTLDRTGELGPAGPKRMTWKVLRGGTKPVVQIEHAKLTLEPCARIDRSETLCLFGTPPS